MADIFDLKKANRYLPHIILIGIGIGSANYFLNEGMNYLQWIIMSICTSLLIGYPLMVAAENNNWLRMRLQPNWKLFLILGVGFFLIGAFTTEVEHAIRTLIFQIGAFTPFSSGKMYLFNGILSIVLGFSFFNISSLSNSNTQPQEIVREEVEKIDGTESNIDVQSFISNIPVREGEKIRLIPVKCIVYIEAYDNYAFVYDVEGQKRLCDYSLGFLEKRLGDNFSRVHRKYIINEDHIKQIKPHLNGRYVVEFSFSSVAPIQSSKSYSPVIRKLIKIE